MRPSFELTNTIIWLKIILSCDIIDWCYHSLAPFIFPNYIITPKIIISCHLVGGGMRSPGGMCPPTLPPREQAPMPDVHRSVPVRLSYCPHILSTMFCISNLYHIKS